MFLVVAVGELLCQGCFFIESDFRLVMVLYVSRSSRNSGAMTQSDSDSLTTFLIWAAMLKQGTMVQSLLPSLILGVRLQVQ